MMRSPRIANLPPFPSHARTPAERRPICRSVTGSARVGRGIGPNATCKGPQRPRTVSRVQRREESRVSEPVLESLEIPRPTTRFAVAALPVAANVERETALAYDEHAARMRAFAIAATRD